jgi:hypothetical protein
MWMEKTKNMNLDLRDIQWDFMKSAHHVSH